MKNTRVNVAIRVRPLLESEIKRGETTADLLNVNKKNNTISLKGWEILENVFLNSKYKFLQ